MIAANYLYLTYREISKYRINIIFLSNLVTNYLPLSKKNIYIFKNLHIILYPELNKLI